VLGLLVLYVCAWLPGLLAHWLLARAIAPVPSGEAFALLVALCASWAVGMLSIIAPAGLGVREGVLYVFVQSWMTSPEALLFVTLSRLLAFLVEVILTLAAFALSVGNSRVQVASGR
jgi:uncharacterized membrane protein YbhN (UPF0104 family)